MFGQLVLLFLGFLLYVREEQGFINQPQLPLEILS